MAIGKGKDRIDFTLKIEQKEALQYLAEEAGISLSDYMREMISERLEEEGFVD